MSMLPDLEPHQIAKMSDEELAGHLYRWLCSTSWLPMSRHRMLREVADRWQSARIDCDVLTEQLEDLRRRVGP